MQIASRSLRKYFARSARNRLSVASARRVNHDIEIRLESHDPARVVRQRAMQRERGLATFALSPARILRRAISGNNFCVAHSATAAAPGREHSRLISPRWSSAELKYV